MVEDNAKMIADLMQLQRDATAFLHRIDDANISRIDILRYFSYIYAYTAEPDKVTDELLDGYLFGQRALIKALVDDQKRLK